eukprot:9052144-Pyramimonas_sp.AAC.1
MEPCALALEHVPNDATPTWGGMICREREKETHWGRRSRQEDRKGSVLRDERWRRGGGGKCLRLRWDFSATITKHNSWGKIHAGSLRADRPQWRSPDFHGGWRGRAFGFP